MASLKTIALDAMGGDHGPEVVVPGAALSLDRQPALRFIFFGQQSRIEAVLQQYPALAIKSRVVHTDLVIAMDEKPSQALRHGKGSSMWLPLEAVKAGDADAAVSAGNTGALMAIAKLVLQADGRHRTAGDCGLVADDQVANASCSMPEPTSAPRPTSLPIMRSWAPRWRALYFISNGHWSGS